MGRGEKVSIGSNKNCGILAQFIVSILSEVNLGSNNFELVFMMHSSLFINGVLFNNEALVNIKQKHIDQLMDWEKNILCEIFSCPRTVLMNPFISRVQ